MSYVVKMVDMDGTDAVTLTDAFPLTIVRELNAPSTATFRFPKMSYGPTDVPVLGTAAGVREVQIYRSGDSNPKFWGPVLKANASAADGHVDCDCAGADWYLFQRAIDGVRDNRLDNGSFEDDAPGGGPPASWANNGGVTSDIVTDWKVTGEQCVELNCFSSAGNISQTFSETAGPIGIYLTAVAWFFLDTITAAPFGNIGLLIQSEDNPDIYNFRAIDTATPIGIETRCEIGIHIPPGETHDVRVSLFCPVGTIKWDAVQVVAMESVSTAGITGSVNGLVDVADIVEMLVAHVQDTDPGKFSNVNIGSDCPSTGVTAAKHYQYADHIPFEDALFEWIDRDDIGDYGMAYTPTARTFTLHPGGQGSDLSGSVTLTYGTNVADYSWSPDGAGTVTRATVLGDGDGPDREEGDYTDAAAVGGLVLQEVRNATQKAVTYSLQPQAVEIVNQRRTPPAELSLHLSDRALIDTLDIGDTVAVVIDEGYVGVAGNYRIVRWELDCETDTLTVGLALPGG